MRRLLDQYAAAFENADGVALTRLLRADAVLEMPPSPTWFAGRDQIGRFLAARVLRQRGDFTMVAVAANGQPGFAAYLRDRDGHYRAHAVHVLTVDATGITRVVSFNQPGLFAIFGLPPVLPR
jgi:RNA polymerase sigma-70 factor (ECF subfamily)